MKNYFILLLVAYLLTSCANKKDIIYFQDIDDIELQNVNQIKPNTEILENDILRVEILTFIPEAAIPYNKQVGQNIGAALQGDAIKLQGYMVDKYGDIELPIVGKVKVKGLGIQEAEKKIKNKLSKYLKDHYVSVQIVNFKYTIQGAVRNPGTFEVVEPNFTLLQALGRAGDLDIRGKRDNILIIRTINGERIARRIDITKSDWMNSPYYFVKQNDYIYIEPNKPLIASSGFVSGLGSLLGLASFALTITLLIINSN